ncbi:MAG: O-antigen ligase family protein [Candidatus Solibacter usitatus]|nr:O-antigen ligase family protein [Candidatus Solibacter usitatus]
MAETQQRALGRAAFYAAFGSASAILFSIAVSNVLLVLSLALLLFSGVKLRVPPIWKPLAVFFVLTILSILLSESPSAGRPQIRKFFVYLILLAVSSTFLELRQVRWWILACSALAALSSIRALMQFAWMLKDCGQSYGCLVGERITGFMSHWMTFGGQMMIALALLTAFLFWAQAPKRMAGLWMAGAVVIAVAIFAGGTRSIWLAAAVAGLYLMWSWKRWTVVAAPVALAVALLAAPSFLKQRFSSVWKPHGELDSNEHRRVSWRTGWRMVQAHPFTGIGPEHVKTQFQRYLPADVVKLPEGWYGHLHNIYLHYAAERGIPALLAILWMLGMILRDFARALRRAPPGPGDAKMVLQGAIAAVIAVMVGGIFEHNLGDSEVLTLFLATVSCGYVAVESIKDAGNTERA